MRILKLAALAYIGLSSSAFAACQIPTSGTSYNAMTSAEKLVFARKTYGYLLCNYKETFKQPNMLHATQEKAFFAAVIKKYETDLKVFNTRTTLPSRKTFAAKIKKPKNRLSNQIAFVDYLHLRWEIKARESCRLGNATGCGSTPVYDRLKAAGKNPRSEFERIAREVRLKPNDPWFLIGKIKFDDENQKDKGFQLSEKLKTAQDKYDNAKAIYQSFLKKLDVAQTARDEAVTRLRAPIEKLNVKLSAALAKGKIDAEELKKNAKHTGLTQFINKGKKRSGQIDAAIENLFANYPASDEIAQRQIKKLRAEQSQLAANVDAARAGRDDMSMPKRTNKEIEAITQIQNDLYVQGEQVRLRIGLEDSKLQSTVNLLGNANEKLKNAQDQLSAALKAHREWQAIQKHYFRSLNTAEADFRYDGKLPDLGPLNRTIDALTYRQIKEHNQLERLRLNMLQMADHADGAQLGLRNAGLRSMGTQFVVEVLYSAYDLLQAARKGGLQGVAAEGWTQFLTNLIFTPSYADANRAHLKSFIDLRHTTKDWKYLAYDKDVAWAQDGKQQDDILTTWAPKAGAQIAKHLIAQPKDVFIDWLEKQIAGKASDQAHKTAMKKIEKSVAETGMADISKLLKPFYSRLKKQEALTKGFNKTIGKAGFKKAALKQSQSFVVGIFKEAGKEVTKQQWAEYFENPAYITYMNAQVDLAIATAKWREFSATYWTTVGLLNFQRDIRDGLLKSRQGHDADTGWTKHKNQLWFAEPGYKFGLALSKEGEKIRRKLKIDLYVGKTKLERASGHTDFVWQLPKNAADVFHHDLAEKQDITIKLQ